MQLLRKQQGRDGSCDIGNSISYERTKFSKESDLLLINTVMKVRQEVGKRKRLICFTLAILGINLLLPTLVSSIYQVAYAQNESEISNVTAANKTISFLPYKNPQIGFKIEYPRNCPPMEIGSLVSFCGIVVGDISTLLNKKFVSLDEVTNEAIKVDTGGGKEKFTSTPITLRGGIPANKIDVKGLTGESGLIRIVTLKDSTANTILLTSIGGKINEANLPIFQQMVDSFQITK